MEANQITCPQCGLVNHHLAEACAQCGIIFVKNQEVKASRSVGDEQKRMAIKEAEAILDQSVPPPEMDGDGNGSESEIALSEDTLEMRIPVEKASDVPQQPQLDQNQDSQTSEIEMPVIEAPQESLSDAIDAEALFLSETMTTQAADASAAGVAEGHGGLEAGLEKEVDSGDAAFQLAGDSEKDVDPKKVDPADPPSESAPAAKITVHESPEKEKSDQGEFEGADPVETQSPAVQIIEPAHAKGEASAQAGSAAEKIACEEKKQPSQSFEEALQFEAPIRPEAAVEILQQPAQACARAKKPQPEAAQEAQTRQQQAQVLEALRRQRERQANAQASSKEQAACAGAGTLDRKKLPAAGAETLKKQKIAQAKAEALKKQKAARAKALALTKQKADLARLEILKNQKAAQAKAEASAGPVAAARAVSAPAVSRGAAGNHERLLSLLKRYKGKAIGINYDNSAEIKEARLVDANEEFFSILVQDKKLQYSYPLKTILTIVEGREGVETGEEGRKTKFDAVIKVFPLVLYK